ncbi:hypothetical protein NDI45_21610 [Leptolyngbya sp. GB1-A1]|uniref:hypothetical protein n=1 Tax=Leptolyngbya sp. GB1-A1 TaxID=2933908 RepID=UPI00329783F9
MGDRLAANVDISGGKRAVWQKNPGLANEQGTRLRSHRSIQGEQFQGVIRFWKAIVQDGAE